MKIKLSLALLCASQAICSMEGPMVVIMRNGAPVQAKMMRVSSGSIWVTAEVEKDLDALKSPEDLLPKNNVELFADASCLSGIASCPAECCSSIAASLSISKLATSVASYITCSGVSAESLSGCGVTMSGTLGVASFALGFVGSNLAMNTIRANAEKKQQARHEMYTKYINWFTSQNQQDRQALVRQCMQERKAKLKAD